MAPKLSLEAFFHHWAHPPLLAPAPTLGATYWGATFPRTSFIPTRGGRVREGACRQQGLLEAQREPGGTQVGVGAQVSKSTESVWTCGGIQEMEWRSGKGEGWWGVGAGPQVGLGFTEATGHWPRTWRNFVSTRLSPQVSAEPQGCQFRVLLSVTGPRSVSSLPTVAARLAARQADRGAPGGGRLRPAGKRPAALRGASSALRGRRGPGARSRDGEGCVSMSSREVTEGFREG